MLVHTPNQYIQLEESCRFMYCFLVGARDEPKETDRLTVVREKTEQVKSTMMVNIAIQLYCVVRQLR